MFARITRHPIRWGALSVVLALCPAALVEGWAGATMTAVGVVGVAIPGTRVRRRWVRLTRWDWDGFETQFQDYAVRAQRRARTRERDHG